MNIKMFFLFCLMILIFDISSCSKEVQVLLSIGAGDGES